MPEDRADIGYRTPPTAVPVTTQESSRDEQDYSTLKEVQSILASALFEIDKWSAFDTDEKELKIKQQIVAHRMAYQTISEAAQAVNSAIATVDQNFKDRQGE